MADPIPTVDLLAPAERAKYEVQLAAWAAGWEARQPQVDRLEATADRYYRAAYDTPEAFGDRVAQAYGFAMEARYEEADPFDTAARRILLAVEDHEIQPAVSALRQVADEMGVDPEYAADIVARVLGDRAAWKGAA